MWGEEDGRDILLRQGYLSEPACGAACTIIWPLVEWGGERETPLEVPSSAARLASAPQSAIVVWWVRLLPVGTARSKRRLF